MKLTGKSFLKLLDLTPEEIGELIELAADLKKNKKEEKDHGESGSNAVL